MSASVIADLGLNELDPETGAKRNGKKTRTNSSSPVYEALLQALEEVLWILVLVCGKAANDALRGRIENLLLQDVTPILKKRLEEPLSTYVPDMVDRLRKHCPAIWNELERKKVKAGRLPSCPNDGGPVRPEMQKLKAIYDERPGRGGRCGSAHSQRSSASREGWRDGPRFSVAYSAMEIERLRDDLMEREYVKTALSIGAGKFKEEINAQLDVEAAERGTESPANDGANGNTRIQPEGGFKTEDLEEKDGNGEDLEAEEGHELVEEGDNFQESTKAEEHPSETEFT